LGRVGNDGSKPATKILLVGLLKLRVRGNATRRNLVGEIATFNRT
jgi:hypothetical protein